MTDVELYNLKRKAVEAYDVYTKLDDELEKKCGELLKDSIDKKDYKESKRIIHNFYKDARLDLGETDMGDPCLEQVLFGKDNLLRKINKLMKLI